MADSRDGTVITFYSYKGGTGRTMALSNVAWILAMNGYRVLAADWDLEAPGLERFFEPFLDPVATAGTPGIVRMFLDYEQAMMDSQGGSKPDIARVRHYARLTPHTVSVDWRFPNGGSLDLLPAGAQNRDYAATVPAQDWDTFYTRLGGGVFFSILRENMKAEYDYALIDSRTGMADLADICTLELPDIVVDCFTLSGQSIDGAVETARGIQHNTRQRDIKIFPVPMRVDEAEKEKADLGRQVAQQQFDPIPTHLADGVKPTYWRSVTVPYRAFYAYEETLATFGDRPGEPLSLLASFERLTDWLTEGRVKSCPPIDEDERQRVLARFARRAAADNRGPTLIGYAPEDAMWGEWIAAVLNQVGYRADPVDVSVEDAPSLAPGQLALAVVSGDFVKSDRAMKFARDAAVAAALPGGRPLVSLFVGDVPRREPFTGGPNSTLRGLPHAEVLGAIFRQVGYTAGWSEKQFTNLSARFPLTSPRFTNVPARNANFTGRGDEIGRLREQLRSAGTSVLLPVALHGLGGVGKTQLAVEYAYRFRADYDLIWWVNAEQPEFIDTALIQLADQLGIRQDAPNDVQVVLNALRAGNPSHHWLLIFDNADDPETVGKFVPAGAGHTIITSRNQAWSDNAHTLDVNVFAREESVAHLQRRVPGMKREDAERLAEAIGDLPFAVAGAGAWLADTNYSVDAFLDLLEKQTDRMLAAAAPRDYQMPSGTATGVWSVSLDLLRERSGAAAKLFDLCSVFAPEISNSLVLGDEMADVLAEFDPTLREPIYRLSLKRELARLALIKNDETRKSIHVHRLLQAVVRARMPEEQLEATRREAHRVLAAARPTEEGAADDPTQWPLYDQLWQHLEPTRVIDSADPAVWDLLVDRVRYLWRCGDLDAGRDTAERLEPLWEERIHAALAADDPAYARELRLRLLRLRFNLGNILRSQGAFEDSRRINESVLAERRELLGENDPHTLITAGSLAADLRAFGDYEAALRMDQDTYKRFEDRFGEGHPRVLIIASNLAVDLRLVGDYEGARERDTKILGMQRAIRGERHQATLNSQALLGRDLRELGNYGESITLLRATRKAFAETIGETAPETLTATMNLAVSLHAQGDVADADVLITQALEGFRQLYRDKANPNLVVCQVNRATLRYAIGDATEAAEILRDALVEVEKSSGANHPYTLACVNNLAVFADHLGLDEEAMEAASRAFVGLRESLGAKHPHTLAAAMTLATCHVRTDPAKAEQLDRQSLEGLATRLGPEHPDTLRCQANLGLDLAARGQSDRVTHEAARKLAGRLGENHPVVRKLRAGKRAERLLEPREI